MDKQEKTALLGNRVRAAKNAETNEMQYAVVDVLEALLGNENGRKRWNRIKNTAAFTREKLPTSDGKMRLTDAATAAQLKAIAGELPAEQTEALAQWLAAEPSRKKNTRRARKNNGNNTSRAAEQASIVAETLAEVAAESGAVASDDVSEDTPVMTNADSETTPVEKPGKTNTRRSRRKSAQKKADTVVTEATVETAPEATVAEDAPETMPEQPTVTPEAVTAQQPAEKPSKASARRSRRKSAQKKAEAAVAEAVEAMPAEMPAAAEETPEAIDAPVKAPMEAQSKSTSRRSRRKSAQKKAEATVKQDQKPVSEPIVDPVPEGKAAQKPAGKTKDKNVQKAEKSTQKAVTKAVAKAAAKAAVKAAEKVVERAAERTAVDETELLRQHIGRRESIAVLIDADNSQFTKLTAIIDELSKFGRIVVRKAYGDWKNPCLKNWEGVLTALAIKPEQQFAYTKGKNATDIALVIDAMDLLATGRYDAFAIICSDSDYTPLVMRLRETGAYVFGAGADRTPLAFINACDVFFNTQTYFEKKYEQPTALPPRVPSPNHDVDDIFHWMENARELHQDETGWTSISDAGSYIKRIYPEFRVKDYGFSKLADLVLAFPERFGTKTYQHKGATILAYRPKDMDFYE